MTKLNVVYDTNLYRSLGDARFQQIAAREAELGIRGMASYFVADELLAHLASTNDPAYGASFNGLKRLAAHCSEPTGNDSQLRFVADSEAQVCKHLFDVDLPRRAQEAGIRSTTVGDIVSSAGSLSPRTSEVLRIVAARIDEVESRFINDLFERIVKSIDPTATSWADAQRPGPLRNEILARAKRGDGLPIACEALVIKAAREAKISTYPHELTRKGEIVLRHFETFAHVYNSVILDLLNGTNFSRSNKSNTVWDLQVAMSTAPGAIIHDAPIWVITDDNRIIEASEAADTRQWFWKPGRYFALLEEGATALDEAIALSRKSND